MPYCEVMTTGPTALLDANVLYPAPLRDLLLRLASTELFRARWTDDIHKEWIGNLLNNRPDLSRAQLNRTRRLMDEAVEDALVTDYEKLIPALEMPDPGDRHVLAAAITCGADVIVTSNLKDFPAKVLQPHGVEAQHPDVFVINLLDLGTDACAKAVRAQRLSMKRPAATVETLLETFERLGLAQTVWRLKEVKHLL